MPNFELWHSCHKWATLSLNERRSVTIQKLPILIQTTTEIKNTGRFILFSGITNIYDKKTKEPTLMELFTATGKLEKFFLTTRDIRCVTRGAHIEHL